MYAKPPDFQNGKVDGLGFDASSIASSGAAAAANYAAASIAAGTLAPIAFGSFAGPVGTVVGAIVSLFMRLFGGGVVKKPWYGFNYATKRGIIPTVPVLLANPTGLWVQGGKLGTGEKEWINSGLPGVLAFAAGGLPTVAKDLANNAGQVAAKQAELFGIYQEAYNALRPDEKQKLTDTAIFVGRGPRNDGDIKNQYIYNDGFDPYVLSASYTLNTAIQTGWEYLIKEINAAFLTATNGEFNPATAPYPFQPRGGSLENVVGSVTASLTENPMLIAAILGGLLIFNRR